MAEFQRYVYELWHFASRFQRGKMLAFLTSFGAASRAFGLPPPKAAGAKRIFYWGRSPKPHLLSLKRK